MLDALFSPVIKVHYDVENSRVGQITDYDRLILDVWTDGSVAPGDAIAYSAKILKDSLSIFITFEEEEVQPVEEVGRGPGRSRHAGGGRRSPAGTAESAGDIIELSVRASNCLKAAKIRTIGDLVSKKDDELISYKNFGKKSLDEIKERLTELSLSLGHGCARRHAASRPRRTEHHEYRSRKEARPSHGASFSDASQYGDEPSALRKDRNHQAESARSLPLGRASDHRRQSGRLERPPARGAGFEKSCRKR